MNKINIPPFEGYDKGPRWEASETQAVAFEDGATFGYVDYEPSLGWYARTLCTAEDGEDEVECYFATAEDAIAYVNLVYLDLQVRIAEYMTNTELLSDEELTDILSATESMELVVCPCDISGFCPYGAEFGTARCAYCGYTEEELNRYLDEDE